jgi:hypothetical protein
MPQLLQNLHNKYKIGALKTLTPAECITQYATSVQSNRRHVLLVASDDKFPTAEQNMFINGSHVYWAGSFAASSAKETASAASSYDWMCTAMPKFASVCSHEIDSVRSNPTAWRVGNYCPGQLYCEKSFPVEYCLSEPAEPHCRLQYDLTIAIVVTVLNFGKFDPMDFDIPSDYLLPEHLMMRRYFSATWKQSLALRALSDIWGFLLDLSCFNSPLTLSLVKTVLMFYIVLYVRDEPLITMGDAVASFLESSDPITKDMCLLSIHDIRKNELQAGGREWRNSRFRWKDVASKKRRATTMLM